MHGKPKPRQPKAPLDPTRNHAFEDWRKKQLAVIHIWKQQLGLDDESYRTMLEMQTGQRSAGNLDRQGLSKVLDWFQNMGCRYPENRKYSPPSRNKTGIKTQVHKIRAIWLEMHRQGVVRDGSEQALSAYCKRMVGVERVQWLHDKPKLANQVIEALKQWAQRAGIELQ